VIYRPRKARSSGRFLSQKKFAPCAAEGTWFGCGFSRGCSSGSKVGLWPVPGAQPGPPTARRLDRPLVASEAAPGPRRTPEHCLRAPISQCPGTTGYNKNKALPPPRHGTAPQPGEAPAAFGPPRGGGWGPVLPPHHPPASATSEGENKLTPPPVPPGITLLYPGTTRCTPRVATLSGLFRGFNCFFF
jgi:hypothetical protein